MASHIQQLPTELLEEIFAYPCQQTITFLIGCTRYRIPIVELSAVCREWRAIFSRPGNRGSTLLIRLHDESLVFKDRHFTPLETVFSRFLRPTSLSVEMENSDWAPQSQLDSLFSFFSPYFPRIRHIETLLERYIPLLPSSIFPQLKSSKCQPCIRRLLI